MTQYLIYSLRENIRKFFAISHFTTRHYSKLTMIKVIREGIQNKITLHKLLPLYFLYTFVCMLYTEE